MTSAAPDPAGTLTELLQNIRLDQIDHANLTQDLRKITYTTKGSHDTTFSSLLPNGNTVLNSLMEHQVPVTIVHQEIKPIDPLSLLGIAVQIAFFVTLARTLLMSSRGQDIMGMKSSVIREVEPSSVTTRFSDVAGADGAKQDLYEVVDFLKNPARYTALGAKVPKGILLVGLPGTGKTLLAKAVAGEAGVPFFECSASSFVELFVGTGAARVRDLFKKAAKKAPCIVFIDEIDAIGKARSGSAVSTNDEREQTINQLLTAMDGFSDHSGVIVLAATNRPDVLDDALTRPGRFDRRVLIDLPDLRGRQAILALHTADKPLAPSVNLELLAKITSGFSGADLANLANEAAMYAARAGAKLIEQSHWDSALEKATVGEERPTTIVTPQKRRITAYHEAGHALLGLMVDEFDHLRKVTIVPRGSTGGVTYFQPSDDRLDMNLVSRNYLENQIIVSLGGRVAEEVVFGSVGATTGAQADFVRVTEIAYAMVSLYGFNETLGPMNWECAPVDVSQDVSAEMRFVVERCYQIAHNMILEQEFYLHRIAEALMEKETLGTEDLRKLTYGMCAKIKKDNYWKPGLLTTSD